MRGDFGTAQTRRAVACLCALAGLVLALAAMSGYLGFPAPGLARALRAGWMLIGAFGLGVGFVLYHVALFIDRLRRS